MKRKIAKWDRNFAIGNDDVLLLDKFIVENNIKNVLEIGPGRSTEVFLRLGCNVTAIEHKQFMINLINSRLIHERLTVIKWSDNIQFAHKFDFGFVDGPSHPLSRNSACELVSKYCNKFMLHDSIRPDEMAIIDKYIGSGWSVTNLDSKRGLALLEICRS